MTACSSVSMQSLPDLAPWLKKQLELTLVSGRHPGHLLPSLQQGGAHVRPLMVLTRLVTTSMWALYMSMQLELV